MIKKILFLFIISAVSMASVQAQILTVSPSDTLSIDTVTTSQSESILVYDVTNTGTASSDSLHMNWRVIYNTLPHGWSLGYCYFGTCLTSGFIGTTFHYTLYAGSTVPMQLDVTPTTGTDSGYFQVETWATGDSAATATLLTYYVALTATPSGITEIETPQISLYPNPARNDLKVILPQYLANGQVSIYDLIGNRVYSQQVNTTKDLDVSSLEPGIYMVRISDGSRIVATKKFTKVD